MAHRTCRSMIGPALRAFAGALGVLCLAAPAARAQGSLSTLGFGYPTGQLSTRALGAGGALGDFDPNAPLNPAALVYSLRALVYLQYDPEFRDVSVGGKSASTSTARFPLFGVSGRIAGFNVGLSFSSFLDRTWTNIYSDTQSVGGKLFPTTVTAQSSGGISDARLALSYSFGPRFHVGGAVHVFPGENRTTIGLDFPDSTLKLGSFTQANIFNYSGSAVSLGVLAEPLPHWHVAATGRIGGALHIRQGDSTVIGNAHVPGKWSLSGMYDGFAGSVLAVRYASEQWGALRGLGSNALPIHDATDFSGGVEVAGPKISGYPLAMRVGLRSRGLPFSPDAAAVKEQSLTAGVGIPVSGGRGAADISVARQRRTAGDVTETGWVVSIGLGIRP